MSALNYITSLGKNITLGKKLLLIMIVISNVALLLISVAVIVYDRQSSKKTLMQEMKVLTNVMAQRSAAALTFHDNNLAEENLYAFSEKSSVINACIYDNDGVLFAVYNGINVQAKCSQGEIYTESGFLDDSYIEKKAIILNGYRLGSLYVAVNLDDMNDRLTRYIIVVIFISLAAAIIALFLAIKLTKIITGPIDDLANAARKINSDKSYSIRVNQTTNDEVGQLVVAFNDMLESIEDRDLMLVDAKKNLEDIVRKRTDELREAQSELIRKDRMATLGQLTATVSHELRNPLGTIRTSIFTLFNRINNKDDSIKHVFERIERNVIRCDSIITELLDYSRIRALQHQKTSLGNWIKTMLTDMDVADNITISLRLDDAVEADIDRDLFRRVLVNILDNAMQSLGDKDDKSIIIECRVNNNRVELAITDTGRGIDQETMPRIFEPLFSTRPFGIGLGLSIVRQIMVQHGGNVEIESEKDVGTRVVLWLPYQSGSSSHIATSSIRRGA